MRHLKTAFGLAAAVCLLGVMAAPALAHEFVAFRYHKEASESEPFKLIVKSPEESKQVFVFGRRTIKCKKATGKGLITNDVSSELEAHFIYGTCGYYPIASKEEYIPASFKEGMTINFKVDGAGEFVGNPEGEELEYGAKAIVKKTSGKIAIGAGKYCTFVIPEQVVPARAKTKPNEEYSTISYSNEEIPVEETPTKLKLFPGGFQHKILLTFNLKPFEYQYGEGTQCRTVEEEEGHQTTLGGGQYKGELVAETFVGNLEFK
jgi:hypothetical protein